MAMFLASAGVLLTALYAYLTLRILQANRAVVQNMQSASAQEASFRMREHFLSGIAAIARYDIASPGCEQAMRLLDYYSSLALELQNAELFNILNTVMTAEIRK